LKIGYFVHDLYDPAVERRVRMLLAGGAEVALFGFRRKAEPVADVAGVVPHDLGRTYDGRMLHRAGMSLLRSLAPWTMSAAQGCDVVLARNLEMLVVATRVRDVQAPRAKLVYECLDIHRLMLGTGFAGGRLRALERTLLARCSLLVVSSPAFIGEYFELLQNLATPYILVENKVFGAAPPPRSTPAARSAGPPWRIGWFGVIRCARSLKILSDLAARNPDRVQVIIRGRPARQEFEDFDGQVNALPNLRFEGPYTPAELAAIYGEVDFTWALDFFEEGGNSGMLLANRLYEGALFGSVSLALAGVETGRWVEAHRAGVTLSNPLADSEALIRGLTADAYGGLAADVAAIPTDDLFAGPEACRSLVRRLAA